MPDARPFTQSLKPRCTVFPWLAIGLLFFVNSGCGKESANDGAVGGADGNGNVDCLEGERLVNGGFEGERGSDALLPAVFGEWAGDDRAKSQGIPTEIEPIEGEYVLQFVATRPAPNGGSLDQTASEVRQAIDLSECRSEIDAGEVRVEARAQFNRILGDPETTARTFGVFVRAYDGPLADLPSKFKLSELAVESAQVSIPPPPDWSEVAVTMNLPAGTDYLVFELIANELVNQSTNEFDGQFADAASLSVSLTNP